MKLKLDPERRAKETYITSKGTAQSIYLHREIGCNVMHLIDKDIYYVFKRFCCPLPAHLNGNNNNNFDMFEQL